MVKINDLYLSFDNEVIFNNFSTEIKKGEKIALTGKSGTGKTSLLNLIAGFISDFKGEINIFGKELNQRNISEIRKNTAWLPQNIFLPEKKVSEMFFAPFKFSLNQTNKPTEKEISEIFSAFELDLNLLNKKNNEISGGQKQRILTASILLLKKELLLFDEPTSALDEKIKQKITDYILKKNDLTIIAATHDEYWIKNSDRVIVLRR